MANKRYTISFPEGAQFKRDSSGDYRNVDGTCCGMSRHELEMNGAVIEEISEATSDLHYGAVIEVGGCAYVRCNGGWTWVSEWDGRRQTVDIFHFDAPEFNDKVTILHNPNG